MKFSTGVGAGLPSASASSAACSWPRDSKNFDGSEGAQISVNIVLRYTWGVFEASDAMVARRSMEDY